MVRLLLGRSRQPRPAETPLCETPLWEPPRVHTLSHLSRGEPTDPGNEPAYWELGDGAVLLRGGRLYVLNGSARALCVAIRNGADDESAIAAVADAWHAEPEAVRDACLGVLAHLRHAHACGDAE